MFKRMVAVEPVGIDDAGRERLKAMCGEFSEWDDLPANENEMARRIGDADAVLISFTSQLPAKVLRECPNVRYIGMCCTLYDENSANVDIKYCREKGIEVTGIRDYGDEGVIEFGISELVRLLHGFGEYQWRIAPQELGGQKVGIIGLGKTGLMMARALRFFGADVSYYSRTRKPAAEQEGISYLPLDELLKTSDIISTHLNKNTVLLHEREFSLMGGGRILLNTAIGPSFDIPALKNWLAKNKHNFYISDSVAMCGCEDELRGVERVLYTPKGSGASAQCTARLSEKVADNAAAFLKRVK